MWLDFDFEDGRCQRGGRYSRRKTLPFVIEEAKRQFARYEVNSGQIGLYESYGGGDFYGYVIKYPGDRFEPDLPAPNGQLFSPIPASAVADAIKAAKKDGDQ